MTRPFHGSELRGLSAVSRSPSFEGRFGRMFRNLPPLLPDDKDLEALARQMVEPEPTGEEDTAGDNPDIPAGFTYFGQFVDHDLTFDPMSQLERDNDPDALELRRERRTRRATTRTSPQALPTSGNSSTTT